MTRFTGFGSSLLTRCFLQPFEELLDLLLPPACPLCGAEYDRFCAPYLCPDCTASIRPLPSPRCPRCALPYLTQGGTDHLCERCLRREPPFNRVIAAGLYRGPMRQAIHRFKYSEALHLDRPLECLLAEAIGQEVGDHPADLILPVPLAKTRLKSRGYNQAHLLARRLARRWGVPASPHLLYRARETPPQLGLTVGERSANVRGAFALRKQLAGERVLLVDDVLTTGATAAECSRTLREGGASEITVAVLARASRLFW